MKKLRLKNEKGITLVALVVTIIILIILAGVSISLVLGENGILQKARIAKENTEKAEIVENAKLDILAQMTDNKEENISKKELAGILNKQFKTVDENSIPDEITKSSDLVLTTTDKRYTINLSEIYNGKVKKAEQKLAILDADKFREKILDGQEKVLEWKSERSWAIRRNVRVLSFEQATNVPENYRNEEHILSTIDSEVPIYVWFEEAGKETITMAKVIQSQSPLCEKNGDTDLLIRKVYWFAEGKPAFRGNISELFCEYEGTNLDLSQWNTYEVTDFSGLFSSAQNLSNLNFENLDTSNATTLAGMFSGCSSLKQTIDFRGKNTSKVITVTGMFSGCSKLENIYLSGCEFGENCIFSGLTASCSNLKLIDMSNVDMSSANIAGMFAGVSPEKIIAPINVKSGMGNNVGFPGTQYDGSDGNTYTGLPEGKTESITLTKR